MKKSRLCKTTGTVGCLILVALIVYWYQPTAEPSASGKEAQGKAASIAPQYTVLNPEAQLLEVVTKAIKSERGSRLMNPDHIDMPPDAMVPINASPKQFIIVVAGGGAPNYNELQPAFSWGTFGTCTVLPIAKWK